MLTGLSIRDFVLIERLDLSFDGGLTVLTGETGAGKSILLDALGLALGARAEARFVRPGSKQASVVAAFSVAAEDPLTALLEDQGIGAAAEVSESGLLMLRRSLGADGRSRAFVNDQPISIALLRRLGDAMVEIQGQFEQRGLLDSGRHLEHLDSFAGLKGARLETTAAWETWQRAEKALRSRQEALAQATREEGYLRYSLAELEALTPRLGEERELEQKRGLLKNRKRLTAALAEAEVGLGDPERGAEAALGRSLRSLEAVLPLLGEHAAGLAAALERAELELREAAGELQRLAAELELPEESLEAVEERYFALADLARKHATGIDALPALMTDIRQKLDDLDADDTDLQQRRAETERLQAAYRKLAGELSKSRQAACEAFDKAVGAELPPLKLGQARFSTRCDPLAPEAWGPRGGDRVAFEIATNPGQQPGPLAKIASGGELARLLLALKVVLAAANSDQTLIFDEVDSGIGGATAAAVGERLERLAESRQVLVVTHSPQVAARARGHLLVSKGEGKTGFGTNVTPLAGETRREEIARMLSGRDVTAEARAAATSLMAAAS